MSPFRALQAPVLLGSISGSGSATFALPPTSGALQIVTPSGTTSLTVIGTSSGASYSAGAPPSSGISSVMVNEAVDRAVRVTVAGANGTTYVTTIPSTGFAGTNSSTPPASSVVAVVAPPDVVVFGSSGYSASINRSGVTAGNVLVACCVKTASSAGVSITGGGGAIWTTVVEELAGASGNYWTNYTFVGTGTAGGSINVTMESGNSGDEVGAVLLELSGAVPGTPVESSTENNVLGPSLILPALTADTTGDLVIATLCSASYLGLPAPWTAVSMNNSNGQGGQLCYLFAVAGHGYAAQWSAAAGTELFAGGAMIIAAA